MTSDMAGGRAATAPSTALELSYAEAAVLAVRR